MNYLHASPHFIMSSSSYQVSARSVIRSESFNYLLEKLSALRVISRFFVYRVKKRKGFTSEQ